MIAMTPDGKIHHGPLRKFLTGWSLSHFTLDPRDVAYLASLDPRELSATIGQLNARVDRERIGLNQLLQQGLSAARQASDMMNDLIAEYEGKGFEVTRIGDEIVVTGVPKDED